ncbi:hypothetical protein ACJRO7_001495 [Eucalyptus globulus]|uniref:RING-type domain-containing protein n=1 Tax=Eucalyptus globulus TaxID=34317 RepID=A0ABD3LWD7_EUCGL
MGSLDRRTKQAPGLASTASRNLNLRHAKHAIGSLLSRLPLIGRPSEADESPDETAGSSRPSPSLVPLPVTPNVPEPAKNPCPMLSYRELVERRGGSLDFRTDTDSGVCTVCMNCLQESDQVRELCYCAHAFHLECLDAWIDQGHDTCPICRAKLWSGPPEEPRDGGADPWRAERMVYLFGEDLEF